MSLYGEDESSTLLWCMFFLRHEDAGVAAASAVAIGHLARLHRNLDFSVVVPALKIVRDEGRIPGQASDALDDIEKFGSGVPVDE